MYLYTIQNKAQREEEKHEKQLPEQNWPVMSKICVIWVQEM